MTRQIMECNLPNMPLRRRGQEGELPPQPSSQQASRRTVGMLASWHLKNKQAWAYLPVLLASGGSEGDGKQAGGRRTNIYAYKRAMWQAAGCPASIL